MPQASDIAFIRTGNIIRVDSGSADRHTSLPVGTYTAQINPMTGPELHQVQDMSVGGGKVYGGRHLKVDKVFQAYRHLCKQDKSTGVMLSGKQGLGKSVVLRQIGQRALEEGLPVVRVEKNFPGIADFLGSLGPAVIMFDEFEKVFPIDSDNASNQTQLLSLFDGTASGRQMYVLTTNSTDFDKLSRFLLDRPGRIRYHIQLQYPTVSEVREYLSDNVPNIDPRLLQQISNAQALRPLVYDQLHAVAVELAIQGPDATVEQIFDDLNIRRPRNVEITLRAETSNGWVLSSGDTREHPDGVLYCSFRRVEDAEGHKVHSIHYGDSDGDLDIVTRIDPDQITVGQNGELGIPVEAIEVLRKDMLPQNSPDYAKDIAEEITRFRGRIMDADGPAPTLGDLLGEFTSVTVNTPVHAKRLPF